MSELHDMAQTGVYINDIHHKIHVVCSCDWKASSCIEGRIGLAEPNENIGLLYGKCKQKESLLCSFHYENVLNYSRTLFNE